MDTTSAEYIFNNVQNVPIVKNKDFLCKQLRGTMEKRCREMVTAHANLTMAQMYTTGTIMKS